MRIIGHGIDLAETDRIEQVWRRHPDRFLERILTPAERAYCEQRKNPLPNISGRWAAKEAILKVIGTGWRGEIAWTDIEILNDKAGAPHVSLSGHTKKLADELGITRILLTITHTEHYAAASAIGVAE
ncbi:MAG: holo-ACP synthase [Phycisphaerales bacterium]|nr:holo-ACP synthase [Phycisphaerales bacterium]MCB9856909.1 holo-ACP synthase [Phycisphaerales bacterium]MCB9861964.1 holo-ACP synthase [Phycisphaerales bacterium]